MWSSEPLSRTMLWKTSRFLLPALVIFSLFVLWSTRNHANFSAVPLRFRKHTDPDALDPQFADIRNSTLGVCSPNPPQSIQFLLQSIRHSITH